MQGLVSDKTFHLKWNNHLQNLSQLFTTIYSSSALADVTLSCRDGTLKAHKLVLSACSPYFEQIFKDNPCQHPIVILKGIPFSEINLLVEFMYKGSVDVQEMDLQSLMHTASELEIRGLAYEARDNAAQLLNVNLEYPAYGQSSATAIPTPAQPVFQQTSSLPAALQTQHQSRTDVERLKQLNTLFMQRSFAETQRNDAATNTSLDALESRSLLRSLPKIHMYQQSMMRAEEIRRRRREDPPGTHTAVNNILAAAAREMEEARHAARGAGLSAANDHDQDVNELLAAAAKKMEEDRHSRGAGASAAMIAHTATSTTSESSKRESIDEERPKKRVSILSPEDDKLRIKKKPMTVRFSDDKPDDRERNKVTSPGSTSNIDGFEKPSIKVVQLAVLQKQQQQQANNDHDDSDEKSAKGGMDDDEETDSSGSVSDTATAEPTDGRPHVCEVCDLRFQRSSHLNRHRLTHTGERPFTCGGCGRSFARSDKLRVHTKICEREDPTVDMTNETSIKRESNSEVMSGMVRTTHRESGHLVFTASGDVMLPPRAAAAAACDRAAQQAQANNDDGDPPRRGRGRPRKTPLPMTPKIKKKRGRPPKTSLDMEGCVLTSGSVMAPSPQAVSTLTPAGQQLLLKRKRGRPPKNYFLPRQGWDLDSPIPIGIQDLTKIYGRPNENYNATNLPFGDFSYLTEMIYNPLAYNYGVASVDPDQSLDTDHTMKETNDRTIDVSDSSSDDEDSRVEPEENVPPVAMETQIMTVGDCQIVKLPPNGDDKEEKPDQSESTTVTSSTNSAVTITPITTVGDCTIRPVENT